MKLEVSFLPLYNWGKCPVGVSLFGHSDEVNFVENLPSLSILSILINFGFVKLYKKILHLNGFEMYIFNKFFIEINYF
jgi:hypothetical protein